MTALPSGGGFQGLLGRLGGSDGLGLLGAYLMAAGAPSTDPGASARLMAQGAQGLIQNRRQQRQDEMQQKLFDLKLKEAEAQQGAREAYKGMLGVPFTNPDTAPVAPSRPLPEGARPMAPGETAPMLPPGLLGAAQQRNMSPDMLRGILSTMEPQQGMKAMLDLTKPSEAQKLMNIAPGGTVFDPTERKPIFSAPTKPEAPPAIAQEYQFAKQQGYEGSFMQYLRDRAVDNALSEIADPTSPTGTRLVPRSEAAGKPGKPGFGQRLTYSPEGGLTLESGRGVGGQAGGTSIERGTKAKWEQGQFDAQARLSDLNRIAGSFDPSYLELPSQGVQEWQKFRDRMGGLLGTLSPEQKKQLTDYSTFQARTLSNVNQVIKDVSGAAVSEQEAKRLAGELPTKDDSPTTFNAKIQNSIQRTKLAIARYRLALSEGLSGSDLDPENLSQKMPLDSVPDEINKRVIAKRQELASQGVPPEQVDQMLEQYIRETFGLGG